MHNLAWHAISSITTTKSTSTLLLLEGATFFQVANLPLLLAFGKHIAADHGTPQAGHRLAAYESSGRASRQGSAAAAQSAIFRGIGPWPLVTRPSDKVNLSGLHLFSKICLYARGALSRHFRVACAVNDRARQAGPAVALSQARLVGTAARLLAFRISVRAGYGSCATPGLTKPITPKAVVTAVSHACRCTRALSPPHLLILQMDA